MPLKLGENARSKTIRHYPRRCERGPRCDRPGRRPDPVFLLRDNRRGTTASPDAVRKSPCVRHPSYWPQFHSSRSGSVSASPPKPANSQVRTARFSGLVNTLAKVKLCKRWPTLCALSSPRSVRGKSVRLVCWSERLHAVSPCLARQTIGKTPLMVSSLQFGPPGTSLGENPTRNTSCLSHLYRRRRVMSPYTHAPIGSNGRKRNATSSERQRISADDQSVQPRQP